MKMNRCELVKVVDRGRTDDELRILALRGGLEWDEWVSNEDYETRKARSGKGFVYFFKCSGLYKIGITKSNPNKRLKAYSTANPFDKTILFCKRVKNYLEVELRIKNKYHNKVAKGCEWFSLSTKNTAWIIKYLNKKALK